MLIRVLEPLCAFFQRSVIKCNCCQFISSWCFGGRKSTAAAGNPVHRQKPPPALECVRGDSLRRSTAAAGNARHAFGAQALSGDRPRRNNNYSIIGISLRRREHLYCHPFPATSTKKWMTPLTLWPSGPQSAARLKSPWKFEARGHAWAQPEWNRADKHPRVPKCLKGTASDARPGYFVNHRGGNPNPPGQSPEESRRRGKLTTRFEIRCPSHPR